jgi:hypothetical protein
MNINLTGTRKFKIPKKGFLYIIERRGTPFEGAKFEVQIQGTTYDVIPSNKSYSLGQIADMIVNLDTMCFDKVQPGSELLYADEVGNQLGIQINQLLMG